MIPRRAIVNLVAFFVVSIGLVSYGYFSLIHNPFARSRTLSTLLPDASGIKAGFSVTMRGVPIGSVTSVRIVSSGVRVTMRLHPGTTVPADVAAGVERANPLGEQQMDLIPLHGGHAAPLPSGATIPSTNDPVPPAVGDVVNAADRLFGSIPTQDLATLIHESAVALDGRAEDLRTIIESINELSETFLQYEAGFRSLFVNAPPVLDAVGSVGPQLSQALRNTQVLTEVLAERRNDIVALLRSGTAFGEAASSLLDQNQANLSCLFHSLADVSANVASPPNLANLDSTLTLNQEFFGPVSAVTPAGSFKSLGPGQPPSRDNQIWFRVRTLIPGPPPPAVAYATPRQLPPTKPGGACLSVFGPGVGPATQADAAPPGPGGRVIPAPTPSGPVTARAAAAPATLVLLAASALPRRRRALRALRVLRARGDAAALRLADRLALLRKFAR